MPKLEESKCGATSRSLHGPWPPPSLPAAPPRGWRRPSSASSCRRQLPHAASRRRSHPSGCTPSPIAVAERRFAKEALELCARAVRALDGRACRGSCRSRGQYGAHVSLTSTPQVRSAGALSFSISSVARRCFSEPERQRRGSRTRWPRSTWCYEAGRPPRWSHRSPTTRSWRGVGDWGAGLVDAQDTRADAVTPRRDRLAASGSGVIDSARAAQPTPAKLPESPRHR